jgi:hypothetical protein
MPSDHERSFQGSIREGATVAAYDSALVTE